MSKRPDKRAADQLRQIRIIPDYLTHPVSSVCMECGGTRVICAVGMENNVPPWMRAQKVPGGWVTSEYGMLPSATHTRTQREANKGKPSGRTMEIQRLIGRSLRSVIDLLKIGPNTIYLDCDVIDADGGTRTASISGAAAALWIAFERMRAQKTIRENPMSELVAAISVGIVDGEPRLDLCYDEDSAAEVDMNVVMTESGKFIEIQGTAEGMPFDDAQLQSMLTLARKGLQEIFKMQREIIAVTLEADKKKAADGKSISTLGEILDNINLS